MLILTIRTDKPESELGLYDGGVKVDYYKWQAHRELAESLHSKIAELLEKNKKMVEDIEGIVIYKGPGSFTGLRIGISVANALAYSLDIPIVSTTSDNWKENGLEMLKSSQNDKQVTPEYGAPVHITTPKK